MNYRTLFLIEKMDCPSEEQLIRMKLQPLGGIVSLAFDLPQRQLTVIHRGGSAAIEAALAELDLGAKLLHSGEHTVSDGLEAEPQQERKLLRAVLAVNFLFFLIEMGGGWLAASMGLMADSLDMLADSLVYGLALLAVGRSAAAQNRVAAWAGGLQLGLAVLGLAEVLRRFLGWESLPDFRIMIAVALLALAANVLSLKLLQKSRSREAHIRASMIFTSNDILANIGMVLAGVLVLQTGSPYPDLMIGLLVFALVARGAFRILKLSRPS
ncbi:cation transporter [Neisseria sp.]|uniref:cation transporter n=1 Tax=Neisseria sp. TaxID=192066 RepID=UPI0035A19AB6